MLKVLVAALLGTIIGIIVMVVVIAISGTDTSGASSVGLSTPLSTYTPSTSTASTPPSSGGGSSGGSSTGGGGTVTGNAAAGKTVFTSAGCSSCHTLSQAGASGTIGPNLNTAIKGDAGSTPLPQFIKESIINPDAVIAKGFSAGIMPTSFGSSLSATDINNLVALIMSGQ
jgi:hypothetical protein